MINKTTLRTIQSGTTEDVYYKVTEAALYMATGGFLKQANKLLTELWKHKLPHDRNTWLPDRAFMMLWYASNEKPGYIPFDLIDIDELERHYRSYIAIDKWAYEMKERDWKEMSGTDLLRTAFKTASLQKNDGKPVVSLKDISDFGQGKKKLDLNEGETFMDVLMRKVSDYNKSNATSSTDSFPSKEKELLAADMLDEYLQEFPAAPDALCLAAELNARNNRINKTIFFAKQWATQYHQHYLGYNFSLMAYGRHVAPLLLKNILTDELKLSEKICDDFTNEAIKVLDKRMENGRSLVYGSLDWRQLIKKLSILSIKYAPEDFSNDIHKSKWIGFEKTTRK
ncbi:MAG: hypothetical protein JO072_01565 [Parafilimonas sp.]|nr:hypothetical protein [Parafilimonas sp.]